jgi:hypothetical protein
MTWPRPCHAASPSDGPVVKKCAGYHGHGRSWQDRGMAEEVMRRYRGRVLYGPFASLDPGDMQALEAETGYPVPVAYRAFLEVAHGGSLDYSVRVPPGPDGEIIAFSDLYRAGRAWRERGQGNSQPRDDSCRHGPSLACCRYLMALVNFSHALALTLSVRPSRLAVSRMNTAFAVATSTQAPPVSWL